MTTPHRNGGEKTNKLGTETHVDVPLNVSPEHLPKHRANPGAVVHTVARFSLYHTLPTMMLAPAENRPEPAYYDGADRGDDNAITETAETLFPAQAHALAHVPVDDIDDEITGHGHHDATDEAEHACVYCGVDETNAVARCGKCSRWFCNGGGLKAGSHIVTHLVHLKHNEVALHEELALGAETLECYNCGNRNVFMLGFVAAKQDLVVVLLCRMPCAQARDINWATNEWQALIAGRALLPWVVAAPAMQPARAVSGAQIARLEAQWRMNRAATFADLADETPVRELAMALLRYTDALEYQNVLAPLVEAEAAYDRQLRELRVLDRLSVDWSVADGAAAVASFTLSTYENTDLQLAVGDEMVLHLHDGDDKWLGRGHLVSLPSARRDGFAMRMVRSLDPVPTHVAHGYMAEIVWKGTSFDRMQNSLRLFAVDKELVSAFLYHKILGHSVVDVEFSVPPTRHLVPGLAALNQSQQHAVESALSRPLSLIQGPPGTGKTVTSTAIVYHLNRIHRQRILVCAPSNVAVDNLALRIHQTGLKVVRLVARSREDLDTEASPLALHTQVRAQQSKKGRRLWEMQEAGKELSIKEKARLHRSQAQAEKQILKSADVICTTCVGAGDWRLEDSRFPIVLVDESTQATEPEVLIPITLGAKQVILVGDHQQLGPVVVDKEARTAGLNHSLFERLVSMGQVPLRLEVQYRMHPSLSEFASNMFYEGLLQNGVTSEDRTRVNSSFPWPVPDRPMMFWANYGKEEIGANGSSYLNRVEAMNVDKIIARLFNDGVKPEQIGIITPYEGQRVYIWQYLSLNSSAPKLLAAQVEIEVSSVDAFQGREKDYIILLCVRANDNQDIGFLSDSRRLNVALTRAKYGLVILGNPRSLSKNKLWNNLLVHYRERGCLVEGPLDNLKFSLVPLGQTAAPKQSLSHFASGTKQRDFDTNSMISHVPEDGGINDIYLPDDAISQADALFADEGVWPSLSSNEVSKLDEKKNQTRSYPKIAEDDLKAFASAFASGLNL